MTVRIHILPIILLTALSSFFTASCSKQRGYIAPNKPFANDSVTTENVTYSNFIHPLLQKNCSTCHGSGGSAEAWWLNDNTYENALRYGNPICKTMLNETMPPTPKYPFLEHDKQLIQAWKDRGMPED